MWHPRIARVATKMARFSEKFPCCLKIIFIWNSLTIQVVITSVRGLLIVRVCYRGKSSSFQRCLDLLNLQQNCLALVNSQENKYRLALREFNVWRRSFFHVCEAMILNVVKTPYECVYAGPQGVWFYQTCHTTSKTVISPFEYQCYRTAHLKKLPKKIIFIIRINLREKFHAICLSKFLAISRRESA